MEGRIEILEASQQRFGGLLLAQQKLGDLARRDGTQHRFHVHGERSGLQSDRGASAQQRAASRRKHHLARLVHGLAQRGPRVCLG